jgi:hypothetical protein
MANHVSQKKGRNEDEIMHPDEEFTHDSPQKRRK